MPGADSQEGASNSVLEWLEQVPAATVVFREQELIAANRVALDLVGVDYEAMSGDGFASNLYSDDRQILADTIANAGDLAADSVLVRLGEKLPVRFLRLRAQGVDDTTVVVVVEDATNEERLETAIDYMSSGVAFTDEGLVYTWTPRSSARVLGIPREDMVGVDSTQLTHPDDLPKMTAVVTDLLRHPGKEITTGIRLRHPRQDTWWQLRVTMIYLPTEPAVGGFLNWWEVGLDFAESSSSPDDHDDQPGSLFMRVAEATPNGIISANPEGTLYFRNSMASRMLGAPINSDDAFAWIEIAREEHRAVLRDLVDAAGRGDARGSTLAAFDRPDGTVLWLRVEVIAQYNDVGEANGWTATLLDVTTETEAREQLRQAQEELWHLANHDGLTGLANRALFVDRLGQALARRRREHQFVALMYCDLDGFKEINDLHGHLAGDTVLAATAARLLDSVRETDTVCRFGGDEFLVLCQGPQVDNVRDELELVAKRIIAGVSEPVIVDTAPARVGTSIGIAIADEGESIDSLVGRADRAMYAAKDSGKGTFVFA